MSEAQTTNERDAMNQVHLKKHAVLYGLVVVASLSLFGAGHTWASSSGWGLAVVTGVASAFAAATVLSSIFHEWSHYAGAALSGSTIKIADKPSNYYFFLGFNPKANSARQALWMTWGGLSGSWLLVLGVAVLVPMDSWVSAMFLATAAGLAVNASVFEVPIAWRTHRGEDFKTALNERLDSPGVVSVPGVIAGLALFGLVS